ncbi:MAG: ubiquitin-like small modifier protein 1 [Candidatus Hodarchaeales archaeon]
MNDVIDDSVSIKTTVRLFASFKQITNKREIEIELEEGATVFQLLDVLFTQHDSLRDKIFDRNNELRKWIQILRNGRSIKFLNGLETTLTNGDVVAVFPPVAGG